MRLKNIPGAKEAVHSSPLVIQNPSNLKSNWKLSFSNNNSIYLEIGCGKGQFISTLAEMNPEISYLGLEQFESVLFGALKKASAKNLSADNLKFLCVHAEYLCDYFSKGEVDRIYLNFSDPWPKKRHSKRRLTSELFLNIYDEILINEGLIEMKTDNSNLFEFSLETIGASKAFEIISYTKDLYNCPDLLEGNIPTEYEVKFHSQGNPINKLIAIHR